MNIMKRIHYIVVIKMSSHTENCSELTRIALRKYRRYIINTVGITIIMIRMMIMTTLSNDIYQRYVWAIIPI